MTKTLAYDILVHAIRKNYKQCILCRHFLESGENTIRFFDTEDDDITIDLDGDIKYEMRRDCLRVYSSRPDNSLYNNATNEWNDWIEFPSDERGVKEMYYALWQAHAITNLER